MVQTIYTFDKQSATGAVNVTTVSSDLYICEPNGTPGPACGSDDSADDETIFEALENMRPGDVVQWDIRLQNVGPVDWEVQGVNLVISETADPGGGCPANALSPANRHPIVAQFTTGGVFVLGKNGDDKNDNATSVGGGLGLLRWFNQPGGDQIVTRLIVAVNDYEDLRLRLEMLSDPSVALCDGNEWGVNWTIDIFEN